MLKKLVFALAMAAPLAVSTPAMATVTTLTLTNTGGAHGSYYGTFNIPVSAGSFSNSYVFDLPSPLYNITTSIVSSIGNTLTGGGAGSSDVVSLLSGTLDGYAGIATSIIYSTQPGSSMSIYNLTFPSPIRAGDMNPLSVTGFAAGANTYNITIDAVYAVPEAGAWAMMIGGFAVIGGAMALRRRRAALAFAA